MSLIPFPTRELFEHQLPSFDLIILQDFEYLPYGIGDYLENIRSYVEGGGGLAMLGGAASFSSGGYYGTPVAAALPVELYGPFDSGADPRHPEVPARQRRAVIPPPRGRAPEASVRTCGTASFFETK